MKTTVYCVEQECGLLDFFLKVDGEKYYIFTQDYKQGIKNYFEKGVSVDKAIKASGKAFRDFGVSKVISKMPSYLRYVEKEQGIKVMKSTKRESCIKRNSNIGLQQEEIA